MKMGRTAVSSPYVVLFAAVLFLACGHLQVQGATPSSEDEMPVVGQGMPRPPKVDKTSRYAAQKHTLNKKGVEEEEEDLLKQALSGGEPMVPSLNTANSDEDFEDKYQPTLEYLEADGAEGQDETDGMAAVIAAEKAYFIARDYDGDGHLSKDEFVRQLNAVDPDDAGEWDTWNVSARGRPAPSKEELMWGKDWTARVSKEQAQEAFSEYDVDKDGKVSWQEWQGIMFHEDNQIPEFRDGLETVKDKRMLKDDELDPEELEAIKRHFIKADADNDGLLTVEEVFKLIVWSHDEPLYPDGVMNYTRPTDNQIRDAAAQLVQDYERDKKEGLTLEEWIEGGGF